MTGQVGMASWFALPRGLMEDVVFIGCTPAEKIFYLHAASELNLRGPFYRADLEEAVTLRLSEDKVRRARRMFTGGGWLEVKPGYLSRGRSLATTYLAAPHAERIDGEFWAPLHRYAFETMLHRVRHRVLSHADVTVFVYLAYFRVRCGGGDTWFITKNDLRELTGLPSATMCVANLRGATTDAGGSRLFDYRDEYHRLMFTRWWEFPDPSEDETAAKQAETYREEIRSSLHALRHPKPETNSMRRKPGHGQGR
jgi:hypothetical protein